MYNGCNRAKAGEKVGMVAYKANDINYASILIKISSQNNE